MSGIGSTLRRHWLEVAWAAFAVANALVIVRLSRWETIPFHFIWVSLTLVYGVRVWGFRTTVIVSTVVTGVTGAALIWAVAKGHELPDEVAEVPLMAAMFVAMVWHARRRQAAMEQAERLAENEHRLLEREREFLRDASHELRTPITVARGHAELIREAVAGSQAAEDTEIVLDELGRLSKISERFLMLAASEHPDFLHRSRVDVEPMLAGMVKRWSPTASRDWRVDVTAHGTVLADRERLEMALDALIDNAVKFTREGARIAVRGRADGGDDLVIEVADAGEGIPQEHLDRVFDRFARADGGRARSNGGTGLGLAVVRAVVVAHGGDVVAESRPGKGSTFRMRLPGFRAQPVIVPEAQAAVTDRAP